MAVASLTRLRPSRIPARRNKVRKCCFTVRGLIRSCSAISLLLHPCSSSCSTSSSRGVILIEPRSTIASPFLPLSRRSIALHNDWGESNCFAKYSLPARWTQDLCLPTLEEPAQRAACFSLATYGTSLPETGLAASFVRGHELGCHPKLPPCRRAPELTSIAFRRRPRTFCAR